MAVQAFTTCVGGSTRTAYEAVPDVLALAAIERAIRHGADDTWIADVGEHLGFRRTPDNTRRLRVQLERLRVHGWATSKERHGREYWLLTPDGERHLARTRRAGQLGALPESPQHRTWRKAGQLSERWVIEDGRSSRRGVIAAELVQPHATDAAGALLAPTGGQQ